MKRKISISIVSFFFVIFFSTYAEGSILFLLSPVGWENEEIAKLVFSDISSALVMRDSRELIADYPYSIMNEREQTLIFKDNFEIILKNSLLVERIEENQGSKEKLRIQLKEANYYIVIHNKEFYEQKSFTHLNNLYGARTDIEIPFFAPMRGFLELQVFENSPNVDILSELTHQNFYLTSEDSIFLLTNLSLRNDLVQETMTYVEVGDLLGYSSPQTDRGFISINDFGVIPYYRIDLLYTMESLCE